MIEWGNLASVIVIAIILLGLLGIAEERGEQNSATFARWYRYAVIISAVSIIVAWFDMPSQYYIYLLRPILFGVAVMGLMSLYLLNRVNEWYFWVLVAFALLHNPILPIFFGVGYKSIWVILNVVYLALLGFLQVNVFRLIESAHINGVYKDELSVGEQYQQELQREREAQREKEAQREQDVQRLYEGESLEKKSDWGWVLIVIGLAAYWLWPVNKESEMPISTHSSSDHKPVIKPKKTNNETLSKPKLITPVKPELITPVKRASQLDSPRKTAVKKPCVFKRVMTNEEIKRCR